MCRRFHCRWDRSKSVPVFEFRVLATRELQNEKKRQNEGQSSIEMNLNKETRVGEKNTTLP